MSDEILREIACPNCRHPIDLQQDGRSLSCAACGSQFILEGHFCPSCLAYHQADTLFCGQCGTALKRTCQRCQTSNWAGHEYCQQCGAALDIFDVVMLQTKEARKKMQEERLDLIRKMKEEEERASARRMQELVAIEEARLAEFQARRHKQAQRDRQMLIAAFLVIFLVVLAMLAFSLLR